MAYSAAELAAAQTDAMKAQLGLVAHMRPNTSSIAAADATDLVSAGTLRDELITDINLHYAEVSTAGVGAHAAADAGTLTSSGDIFTDAYKIRESLRRHFGRGGVYPPGSSGTGQAPIHFGVDTAAIALLVEPRDGGVSECCRSLNASKAAFNAHLLSKFASAVPA